MGCEKSYTHKEPCAEDLNTSQYSRRDPFAEYFTLELNGHYLQREATMLSVVCDCQLLLLSNCVGECGRKAAQHSNKHT